VSLVAKKQPRHIPESLVHDFDMFDDPAYNRDPYQRILELKNEAPPIFWTRYNGGFWIVQGYQAALDIVSDPMLFSNAIIPHGKVDVVVAIQRALATIGIKTPRLPRPYPIMMDPPLHARYRQPLQGVFSPVNVNKLETQLRTSAAELIDRIADKKSCEFMSAIAEPLPVLLFMQLMGLSTDKLPEYRALLKKQLKKISQQGSNLEKLASLQVISSTMRSTLLDRRDNPQDDLISMLWAAEIDGKPMTLDVMENYAVLLFIAGLDTVVNSMGFAMRHLALNPEQQQALREQPGKISDAVEEILRRYAIALPPRRVTATSEFHGVRFKKNDVLYLFLHGANLDAAQFENPQVVDFERPNARRHLTFNSGPHHCLGAYLARLELRVLYEEMLSRLPVFRLDEKRPPVFDCGFIVALNSMHLVW